MTTHGGIFVWALAMHGSFLRPVAMLVVFIAILSDVGLQYQLGERGCVRNWFRGNERALFVYGVRYTGGKCQVICPCDAYFTLVAALVVIGCRNRLHRKIAVTHFD